MPTTVGKRGKHFPAGIPSVTRRRRVRNTSFSRLYGKIAGTPCWIQLLQRIFSAKKLNKNMVNVMKGVLVEW